METSEDNFLSLRDTLGHITLLQNCGYVIKQWKILLDDTWYVLLQWCDQIGTNYDLSSFIVF